MTPTHELRGMERCPTMSVLLTGGLRTPSDALVGPIAISALKSLHLDAVFMGVHGMDARAGFSTPNLLEAETNRAMVASGRRLIVLADSTKWGVVGLSTTAELSEASFVITDTGLSAHATQILGNQVDELILLDRTAFTTPRRSEPNGLSRTDPAGLPHR